MEDSFIKEEEKQESDIARKLRRVKKISEKPPEEPQFNFDEVPGVVRVVIPTKLQNVLECVPGIHVTLENSWKYVSKKKILDDLSSFPNSSEFLPTKPLIFKYPYETVLLGHIRNEDSEEGEESYYLCVTSEAENQASKMVDEQREKKANKLKWFIEKKPRKWKSGGSENIIEEYTPKSNRPLLMVELETKYPIRSKCSRFRIMHSHNFRDGYVELVAGRAVFNNLIMQRIEKFVQVTPNKISSFAQTVYPFPKNAWCQYEYAYKTLNDLNERTTNKLITFVEKSKGTLYDYLYVNGYINFYTNDYRNLIYDIKYTRIPQIVSLKEYTSFVNSMNDIIYPIASVCWHPMWTGIVAVSYSEESFNYCRCYDPLIDEVFKATFRVLPVFLWSFKDNLFPRLYLLTPREVTAISFCPNNPNLVVGGCVSGQILVWDITGKLEAVEKEEILTSAQQIYRKRMRSLMNWMLYNVDVKYVRPAIVSNRRHSHTSPVSTIKWLNPYHEITRIGKIREIEDNEHRTSLSFLTAARDGTILSWDLSSKALVSVQTKRSKSSKRLKKRPAALVSDLSPYKALNNVFTPTFQINVLNPSTLKPLPITGFSLDNIPTEYIQEETDSDDIFDIKKRLHYRAVLQRPEKPIQNQVILGTTEGDIVEAKWEGLTTNSGETVNKEDVKIESFIKFHDGPLVCVTLSDHFPDLLLTVGGKIFALWKLSMPKQPVFWRKCEFRLTNGSWNPYRPSMFNITRNDGAIEFWHLNTRSDKYQDMTYLSPSPLLGAFVQPRKMPKTVIGIADARGSFRLFFTFRNLIDCSEKDKGSTNYLCERDLNRKLLFNKWQNEWISKNSETLLRRKIGVDQTKRKSLTVQGTKGEKPNEKLGQNDGDKKDKEMKQEHDRLMQILLQKKQFDVKLLEKQREPLLKMEEDRKRKQNRLVEHLQKAEHMFDDSVATNFPQVLDKKKESSIDLYLKCHSDETKMHIMEDYRNLSDNCDETVKNKPYKSYFNWLNFMKSGKTRRNTLDRSNIKNSHRNRIAREKLLKVSKDEIDVTNNIYSNTVE